MSIEISGLDIAIRRMQTIEKQFASLSDVTNSSSGFQSILDAKLNKANDNNSQSKVFKNEIVDKAEIDGLIEKYSNKNGLDKDFVKALVKQESGFNPKATSHCGAMGLMQLMPATAKGLGVKDAYNPTENIEGGVKHLKGLLARYNGNVVLALAAYNAGGGNVDKYGGVPPFKETQNYVKNILANYLS